jgi:AmmeMemoRadiSam system protein B
MSVISNSEYPKLRQVDVRTQVQNGQPYFLLRDPLQLSENSLLVPQPWGGLLAAMDGRTSIVEAAHAFRQRFGVSMSPAEVLELVDALDDVYLLDNERAAEALRRSIERYRATPFRPPRLAGQGYPAGPTELAEYFDGFLAELPKEDPRNDLADAVETGRFGLLSPHIDYPRGGRVYAQVWQQAQEAVRAADLVILLGTDHYGNDPFTLTRQNYATPYGVLPTAVEIVDEIASAIGEEAAYAGELRHQGEHSLELVAAWLHHMRGGMPVEMVPILVGSLYSYILNGASPETDAQANSVLDVLRRASRGRRVAVIASGDLAHVGTAFGGEALTDEHRMQVRTDDEELIRHMERADARGFFESIRRVRDRNNVCGVTPIYLTLRLLDAKVGEMHGYASCPADATDTSAVTVCGVVWK